MRRRILFFTLILMALAVISDARGRAEIVLDLPAAADAAGGDGPTVFISEISDDRRFEDRPAEANIPSVAEGGVAATTPEQRLFFIARVRDGYGKARNNIFLDPSQPVDLVVRGLLEEGLADLGYRVVGDPAQATVTVDVAIDRLWGYILVKGGGWAGTTPKMAGEMTTTLTIRGPGETVRQVEVSGETIHKFGLMTKKHWVQMFSELFEDFLQNLRAAGL